jgi:PAS domain S-box-containing protein
MSVAKTMNPNPSNSSQKTSAVVIFILLLLAIFVTEMSVMELLAPVFSRLHPVIASLVDAAVLATFYAPPLWIFIVKPLVDANGVKSSAVPAAHLSLFVKSLSIVFLVEFLVMLLMPAILPKANDSLRNITDAALSILFCAFPLWGLLSRYKTDRCKISLTDLLLTPLKLFVLLLFLVFLMDLLQELLTPYLFPDTYQVSGKLVDSFLTTLFTAPFIWWFVVRPLRLVALSEKSRADAVWAQVVEAIVTLDDQQTITSFNPAAERIFGHSAAAVVGRPAVSLLSDDRECFEMLLAGVVAAGDDQAPPETCEVIARHRDGSLLTMEVSLSKVLQQGKERLIMVMRDITSRKQSEQALRESETRFRQIFEQSEDAIIFLKPGTCTIIDLNGTSEKLYGYSKAELKAGGLECLTRPEDFNRLRNTVCNIRRDEMTHLDNIVNLRKDGTEFIVSVRGKVMTLLGVDIVYCTFRDITERIRMEEEARTIEASLIQANKMTSLGLLVSGVAHEINNPNNFIMANTNLLGMCWEDAVKVLREYSSEHGEFLVGGIPFSEMESQIAQLHAGIGDGARRINDIINNLKSFARQDRVVADQAVDVNQVLKSAVSILHHEIVKYTEQFHLDLGQDVPVVKGSGQQLGQVFINLLMNACQALPSRKSGIWAATAYDGAAGQVTVVVRDEGCGMARDVRSRIMEPFFTTKLDHGGTGLGLSISHAIVKEHNGTLECTSEPGQGTTFTVRIPAGYPAHEEKCR